MSLELHIEQINNSADNTFYNAFFNAVNSITDNAVNNAVDNTIDMLLMLTSSYLYSILIFYQIMASEGPLFDRYVPMAYTDLWPLQLLKLTRAQAIKILLLVLLLLLLLLLILSRKMSLIIVINILLSNEFNALHY
jgi:hypothetical protein